MPMRRQSKDSRRTSSYTVYQDFQPEIKRRALNFVHSILNHYLKARKVRIVNTHGGNPSIFLPRMDVMNDINSRKAVAVFELPGVRSDELTVSVHDGVLHLNGKRSARTPEAYGIRPAFRDGAPVNKTEYKTQELRYGLFKREVALPEGIKEQDVTATLKDGLLIVTWPLPGSLTSPAPGHQENSLLSYVPYDVPNRLN